MNQQHYRSISRSPQLTKEDMAANYATRGLGGGALEPNFSRASDDVVFYVGKHRHTYHVNSETLTRSSAFFRNLLDDAHMGPRPPIVIDCEEGIFESLLLLMRYGTLEALPPMSAAESFRLAREAAFYGIRYTEPPKSRDQQEAHVISDDCGSDLSCSSPASCSSTCSSSSSSPSGSPKSMIPTSSANKRASHSRYYEGARLACSTPRQLAELPEFPLNLADPARLVLVSCVDQEKASMYTCDCTRSSRSAGISTQWAINFHHRHAFCTACGRAPNLSPKHFAEMFMAAAAHYHAAASPAPMAPNHRTWRVSSDSTCTLRLISSGAGGDACGACSAGGAPRARRDVPPTIWAANYFYSHAFCTCCGEAAKGPVLLSLMLTLRYGGSSSKASSFRMDSQRPSTNKSLSPQMAPK